MAFFAQVGADPYRNQAGQLGQALGQGLGVHFQRGQMQQNQRQLEQQQGQLAKALFGDQAQQFAGLPVEQQLKAAKMFEQQKNQQELSSMLGSIYGGGGQSGMPQMDNQTNQGMQQTNETNILQPAGQSQPRKQPSDAEIAAITLKNPVIGKLLQDQKSAAQKEERQNQKDQQKKLEESKPFEIAQKSFNSMAKLLKKGNLGLGSETKGAVIGGETAKDTAQFSSASGGLEAMLVDMVSRGTLSNTRFKYITETLLPKPGDRDKTIEGKLTALAEMLGLDASELTGKKTASTDSQNQERPPLSSFNR